MAKLTDLTIATAVTLDSLIHIVNTGDTTQSAFGSSYKTNLSQLVPLFSGSPSGGVSIDPYNDVGDTGTTLTWNVSGLSTNFQARLTGNTTLSLTNVRNGEYGTLILTQDGVGSRTITFGTVNGAATTHRVANGGGGTPTLTSNATAIDILTFTYNGTTMFWTVGNDYT